MIADNKDKPRPSIRKVFLLVCIMQSLFFVSFTQCYASSEIDSSATTLYKLLSNGEIRRAYRLAKRNWRNTPTSFWEEQVAICSVHRKRVNKRSIKVAKSSVADSKDPSHALATLAIVLAVDKRADLAIKVADKALKTNNRNARALMAKALAKLQTGDSKSANNIVLNAVTLGAGDIDVMFLAVQFYEQTGATSDILNTLDLWIKEKPDCAYAYYLKGKYLYEGLSLNSAIIELKKAISLNPTYWNAKKVYAYILTYQKKYKEASQIFQSILMQRKGFGVTYIHYAECLEALGQRAKAIENYTTALEEICDTYENYRQVEAIPNLKPLKQRWAIKACASRARLMKDTDNVSFALREATLLTNYYPQKMEPRYIKMLVLTKMGKFNDALKEANFLINENEDISLFYRKRAEINRGLKQAKKADMDIKLAEKLERTGSVR